MQEIYNEVYSPKKLIILLGLEGPDKAHKLLSLLRRSGSISICSRQNVLQNHLTLRENLQLMASLYGEFDEANLEALVQRGSLSDGAVQERVYTLPLVSRRMLGLLIALLPNPDILFIDDLTSGLSPQAKRGVWNFILTEQKRQPRMIFYVTNDLEAARTLGDEIWLVEDGEVRRKWLADEIPAALRASASFAIELKSAKAAQKFYTDIKNLEFVSNVRYRGGRIVEVLLTEGKAIVTLTWMAGYNLIAFRSLPLDVDRLSDGWHQDSTGAQQSEFSKSLAQLDIPYRESSLAFNQLMKAIWQIALTEWRKHFRSFWKAGNLLLTGIWILSALSLVVPLFGNWDLFLRWGSLPLLFSSTMSLGFGLESTSRLTSVGEMNTLFHPARPKSQVNPLSPLALFDLTHIGRGGLLSGIVLGQFLILVAHAWPLLFYAWGVSISFSPSSSLLAASIIFWLLTAMTSVSLTVLISGIVRRPGWGYWLGWLLCLLVVLSSHLPSRWAPVIWLWPLAGYAAAFEKLLHPQQILQPLGLALLGTLLSWLFAVSAFRSRSAIWLEK